MGGTLYLRRWNGENRLFLSWANGEAVVAVQKSQILLFTFKLIMRPISIFWATSHLIFTFHFGGEMLCRRHYHLHRRVIAINSIDGHQTWIRHLEVIESKSFIDSRHRETEISTTISFIVTKFNSIQPEIVRIGGLRNIKSARRRRAYNAPIQADKLSLHEACRRSSLWK